MHGDGACNACSLETSGGQENICHLD